MNISKYSGLHMLTLKAIFSPGNVHQSICFPAIFLVGLSHGFCADAELNLYSTTLDSKRHVINAIGMEFERVENGTCVLGSKDSSNVDHESWPLNSFETPRKVSIRQFYLQQTELQNRHFIKFVNESGYDGGEDKLDFIRHMSDDEMERFRDEFHPVVYINVDDVNAFCEWLGRQDGNRYRLPSEEEWEYACKGGSRDEKCDEAKSIVPQVEDGWFFENSNGHTHPVRLKEKNRIGLFDMHGNVWEWTSSEVGKHIKAGSPFESDVVLHIRGGSFINVRRNCTSASRWAGFPPWYRGKELGVRLAIEIENVVP